MNLLIESFAWCMLQVTILGIAIGFVYKSLGWLQARSRDHLLLAGLVMVSLLTLWCASPWPSWSSDPTTPQVVGFIGDNALPNLLDEPAMPDQGIGVDTFQKQLELESISGRTTLGEDEPRTELLAPLGTNWESILSVAVDLAWIAAAAGLLRLAIGIFWLRRHWRSSIPIDEEPIVEQFRDLFNRYALTRPVELRESPTLPGAATAGWRRPFVLLPTAWREWSAEEQRAVLAHELAHVRQRHFAAWCMSQFAVVLHYYHPLVHWLARSLRFEQEAAADSLAADVFGDRQRYAIVLAALALKLPKSQGRFATMGLFMSRPLLMRRIAMLRQTSDSRRASMRWPYWVAFSILGMAVVAVAGLRSSRAADEALAEPVVALEDAPPASEGTLHIEGGALTVNGGGVLQVTTGTTIIVANDDRNVVALIQVSRQPSTLIDDDSPADSDTAWQVFCKTQVALLRSKLVLQAALHDPAISGLELLKGIDDPIQSLQVKLIARFEPDTEILYVGMNCSKSEAKDAAKLVDAIVKSYMNEVVNKRRREQLHARDLLGRGLENLKQEAERKSDEYMDIAREADRSEGQRGDVMQELVAKRIDRVETELMRLEDAQLKVRLVAAEAKGTPPEDAIQLKFFEERIAQLEKRRHELERELMTKVERSTELEARERELQRLQHIVDELSVKLEVMDINAESPERIRVIQHATSDEN